MLAYTPTALSETILVLGDSLSAAYGIKREQGWVSLLGNSLGDDYQLVNASISGETTGGGLNRLPTLLKQHQPDYVIVELGGNDGLRGQSIATMKNNLNRIIDLSQAANAKVLMLGMHVPPNYGKRYAKLFHQSFLTIAEQRAIPIVPFFLDGVAGDPALIQADRIHPNAKAQSIMLENVRDAINTLLQR